MKFILVIFFVIINVFGGFGKKGFGPGDQDWAYVEVRPHCHMFWWLHHTTADTKNVSRPLLVWLQGGPASSASGEGNILMSGLVDQNFNEREFSYVHKANVLYVDSPVGAGYSYVDEQAGGTFARNTEEMALDFVALLKGFFQVHPEFETVPLYLMGESFGGKFAPAFAKLLSEFVQSGEIRANLKGVGLAYPATHHLHHIPLIGDTLYHYGIADEEGRDLVNERANGVLETYYSGEVELAWTFMDRLIAFVISNFNVSFLRVTSPESDEGLEELIAFMDTTVSPLLNLTAPFARQIALAREAIADKLIPTTSALVHLLEHTDCKVFIFNGQLDWIVNTLGTATWLNSLEWSGAQAWKNSPREAFYVQGIHEGHMKRYAGLEFYWIKRAGHRLPNDNPNAMSYILERLIAN